MENRSRISMPDDANNVLEEISKTSIQLILNEPFYGHFFIGLMKELSDRIPTAGVGLVNPQMVKLLVNEDFWNGLTNTEHRYGLIKHEVLHIVLLHLNKQNTYSHKRLYNIAADLVVNQYIEAKQLPAGGITLERLQAIQDQHNIVLERDQDVGYYYRMLRKLLEDETGGETSAVSKEAAKSAPDGQLSLDDLVNDELDAFDSHKFWKEVESLSEAERKVLERSVSGLAKQAMQRIQGRRGIGDLPGYLQQYLEALLETSKPNLDWRRALRVFASSSRRTFLKGTIARPSKRFGTTPGIKIKRKQKILIAIDTSRSVSLSELRAFFGEIYHVWRQGAEVFVVECDTQIHKQYDYEGKMPEVVSGRGGTCFDEPIAFANRAYRPDAIVYFSDGRAPTPTIASRCPIMWLVSAEGLTSEDWKHLPGRKCKMNS